MTEQKFPLTWPDGWRRTPQEARKPAQFGKTVESSQGWKSKSSLSISDATKRLMTELDRLGARDIILSSNLKLGKQGFPLSDQSEPKDGGVAVYFELLDKRQVLACDKWTRIADNIAAVAAHIDAIRRQERYGVGTMAQAFAGYTALPAPKKWWDILGCDENATIPDIDRAFKAKCMECHPDRPGGSHEKMAEVNGAMQQAKEARL